MIHFYAKTFRLFFFLLPLLYLENVTAQTLTNCPTSYEIFPTNDFTGTLPPYRFYHANGTHSNTFYKDEVIYSIAPTTNGSCLSPVAAIFRTPQVPSSFSALCTGVRVAQFYLGSSSAAGGPNCESMITSKTCQRVGPTQWFASFYQKFQATESGTYNITFDNSTGTTVTINVLERFCVQTDCQNFSGEYIEKGIRNGHTYYADSDNNELFYDETSAAWVIGNSTGNPFKVVSTSATVPTNGWVSAEGEAGVGFTVNVSVGGCIDNPENYSVSYPTYYKPTVKVVSSCIPALDGDYFQTSFVDGKPRFSSASGATIYFSQSAWFVKPPTGNHYLRTPSLAALPPSDACWFPFTGTDNICTASPNIVATTLTKELVSPQKICVRTDCGNFGGIYTQTTIVNQRPNLYDEFNNRIFYFGAGNPAQPEGWYISNSAGKNVYYNSATTETIPTSNWQVFTVDGITCSSNIGVFDTECPPCPSISADISYGNILCKSLNESTVTFTGTTGGTFSSTQGLSIDANSGTINPSTSTTGTYTVTYTIAGTNGCANTTATTSVTIEASKTPSIVLAANPSSSITTGTNVTFTATPTNGGTTPAYVWKKDNVVIPSETGAIYTTNTLVNGDKIKVEMTSSDACASPVSATSNEITMTVTEACNVTPPNLFAPTEKVICFPNTLTLTATGCNGTVNWSNGSSGTSLTLSNVATYAISATCTENGCTSDESTIVNGLEIKAKPSAPTVNAPTMKVVCFPNTLTLTATGCAGTFTWSNNSTGTSLTISAIGTYAISANCTVNGCTSDASTTVADLEIKVLPNAQAINTGPYIVGQTINLIGSGGAIYNWAGPNNFSSTQNTPSITNAVLANNGVYTLTVTGQNACVTTATTNVIITGVDLCDPARIVDYLYVKAGNPYQALFPLTDGMVINQRNEQVSILVNNVCPAVTINSFEMNIQGPELNWNIIQNVAPYALFDNLKLDIFGRNFVPGNYTLTVTGYAQTNKGGSITYGAKIIRFTVVGNLATINAPILSKNNTCAGNNVDVSIATSGSFIGGNNTFQVQLSDSSGSFTAPRIIGTSNSTGTISCMIPLNTVEGSKYLIRVASSNQVVASNPAISFVKIHPFNYVLSNPINNISGDETIKAVSTINANNKIISPANVSYQAGNSILFTPGFESSAVFKAEIKGCNE